MEKKSSSIASDPNVRQSSRFHEEKKTVNTGTKNENIFYDSGLEKKEPSDINEKLLNQNLQRFQRKQKDRRPIIKTLELLTTSDSHELDEHEKRALKEVQGSLEKVMIDISSLPSTQESTERFEEGRAFLERKVDLKKSVQKSLTKSLLEEGGELLQLKAFATTNQINISMGGLIYLHFQNQRLFIATGKQGIVEIWNIEEGRKVFEFSALSDFIMKVIHVHLENRDFLVTAAQDGTISLWDANKKFELFNIFEEHEKTVYALLFIEEKGAIISGGKDERLCLWTVEDCETVSMLDLKALISSICLVNDGQRLAVGLENGVIAIVSITNQLSLIFEYSFEAHKSFVSALQWLKHQNELISGSRDGLIICWKIAQKHQLSSRIIGRDQPPVSGLVVYEDRNLIISNHGDQFLRTWNLSSGKMLGKRHDLTFGGALISTEDGLVITSHNYTVGIWSLRQ